MPGEVDVHSWAIVADAAADAAADVAADAAVAGGPLRPLIAQAAPAFKYSSHSRSCKK